MSESGPDKNPASDVSNHCAATTSAESSGTKADSEIVAMEAGENCLDAAAVAVPIDAPDNNHCKMMETDSSNDTKQCDNDKDLNHSDHACGDRVKAGTEEEEGKQELTLDRGDLESDSGELSLGVLKKDDSGIVCEKSPVRDTDSCRTDNSSASTSNMDGGKSRTNYPSTSNESEGVVADFVDDAEAEAEAVCPVKSEVAEDKMSGDETAEETAEACKRLTRHRLQKRLYRSGDSDSQSGPERGSNDEEEDDTESEPVKSEDDNEGVDDMYVDLTTVPHDPWRPLQEIRRREIGHNQRIHMPFLFRASTGSSVNLVKRLKQMYKLEHHDGCVNALHFNDSGTLLASGSDDLNIVIWDWARGKRYMVFESGHRSNVFQSKFMPYTEDMHIVSCARDGQVRLAELSTTGVCKGTRKLTQHRGAAHKLALLSDSSHVFYSCGEDGITYQIDLRQDKPNKLSITKENNKKIPLYSIHSNPFKSYEFCVGGRDHLIRVYDKRMLGGPEEGETVKKFCPHHLTQRTRNSPRIAGHPRTMDSEIKANVTCAVYNYNGTEILGTYNDEHIYLFNSEHSDGADYIHKYQGHRNNATVKGVNFYGPRSEFVVSGSDCGNVFLWDKESEKIVQYFHADEGGVINVLEPHPHNPVLATSGLDHDVKIWAPTAKEPTDLEGIRQLVRKNHKDREEERAGEPDMIDGQMLWLLMQHLRRTTRRRAREDGEDASSSTSDSEPDSDDGSEDMPEGVQCASS